jgi:hypothetical protein
MAMAFNGWLAIHPRFSIRWRAEPLIKDFAIINGQLPFILDLSFRWTAKPSVKNYANTDGQAINKKLSQY